MDIRVLKYYQSVYENRSVSAAARACFISQPSISAAIRQLESELSVVLFVRHPKGVNPTEDADRLYPLSKKLTGDAQAIVGLFQTERPAVAVRLGIKRSLGAVRLGLLLKDMVNGEEPIELTLVSPEEPCDARIVSSTDISADESFIPIWTDTYQLALPLGHPLRLNDRIVLEDFQSLPFVHRHPCELVSQLENTLIANQMRWTVRAKIRTIEYGLALVKAGVGAALLPDWDEITRMTDIVMRPIEGQTFSQTVGLAYQKGVDEFPLMQQVLNAVALHTTAFKSHAAM